MKMVTTCPACATAFRIHREQLDARAGQVRCGHCHVVFDAHMHLQIEAELPPPMEEGQVEHDTAVIPIEMPPAPAVFETVSEAASAAPEPARAPRPKFADLWSAELPPQQPAAFDDGPDTEPVPTLEELGFPPEPKVRTRGQRAWGAIAALLILLLLGQLVYQFRGDIALYLPESKPLLQAACEPLGCIVPLPRRSQMLSIEADELQVDPAHASVLTLRAVLRNRAPFDQAYPALELSLTDDAQGTISRRVLRPSEYLEQSMRDSQAFAANSEVNIKLHIDAAGLNVGGYLLEILYL
jgi:predicted Zn finger-like uncharacterized protein